MCVYTWIRPKECQPFVITFKFPVNQSGTLAGWVRESGSFRTAGLISTWCPSKQVHVFAYQPAIKAFAKTAEKCNEQDRAVFLVVVSAS